MPKSSCPIFVPGKGEQAEYLRYQPAFWAYINAQSSLRKKPAGFG